MYICAPNGLIKAHQDYDDAAEDENRPAYHATHRDMHMAWTLAHPTIRGLSIVHRTWVIILIPIAPLCVCFIREGRGGGKNIATISIGVD